MRRMLPTATLSAKPSLSAFLLSLPLFTLGLCAVLIFVHVAHSLVGVFAVPSLCLSPLQVVASLSQLELLGSVRRLACSPFVHANLSHLALNTLSLASIGTRLEDAVGTVQVAALHFWCLIGSELLYVVVASALRVSECVIGYSAILFGLWVVHCLTVDTSPVELGPGYVVPAWTAPLLAIVLIQVLLPNVSFLGHVCGAAFGVLMARAGSSLPLLPTKPVASVEGVLAQCSSARFRPCPLMPIVTMAPQPAEQGHRLGSV
jgi:glycosylphosphatidylinositol transamidase